MPNTACAFGKGVTASMLKIATQLHLIMQAFTMVGHVLVLQSEEEMYRFTSIIGSGQAFFPVLNIYLQELKKFHLLIM